MRQELDDLLCQRYPDIFIDRHSDPTMSGMYWGFCCGDGWFDLIDSLCAVIAAQVAAGLSPPVVARQVKEKFGRLRFHFRGGNDETRRLVQYAEDRSEVTCETCGQPILRQLETQRRLCAKCQEGAPMPNIMSFETIDELEMLRHDLCAIRRLVSRLLRHKDSVLINEKLDLLRQANDEVLACVEKSLAEAQTDVVPKITDLPGVKEERIGEFDNLLRKLTNLLQHECTKAQEALDTCLADQSDPMADFEIDVRIDYAADENAPGYSEDSDNHLTSRDYPMRQRYPGEPSLLSGEWGRFGQEASHCWLFHDLTEHNNGLTQPAVAPEKIYAIGRIWAEVVFRRQYLLDTRTGSWVRP